MSDYIIGRISSAGGSDGSDVIAEEDASPRDSVSVPLDPGQREVPGMEGDGGSTIVQSDIPSEGPVRDMPEEDPEELYSVVQRRGVAVQSGSTLMVNIDEDNLLPPPLPPPPRPPSPLDDEDEQGSRPLSFLPPPPPPLAPLESSQAEPSPLPSPAIKETSVADETQGEANDKSEDSRQSATGEQLTQAFDRWSVTGSDPNDNITDDVQAASHSTTPPDGDPRTAEPGEDQTRSTPRGSVTSATMAAVENEVDAAPTVVQVGEVRHQRPAPSSVESGEEHRAQEWKEMTYVIPEEEETHTAMNVRHVGLPSSVTPYQEDLGPMWTPSVVYHHPAESVTEYYQSSGSSLGGRGHHEHGWAGSELGYADHGVSVQVGREWGAPPGLRGAYPVGPPSGPGGVYPLDPPSGPGGVYPLDPPSGPGGAYRVHTQAASGGVYPLDPPSGPGRAYRVYTQAAPGGVYPLDPPLGPSGAYRVYTQAASGGIYPLVTPTSRPGGVYPLGSRGPGGVYPHGPPSGPGGVYHLDPPPSRPPPSKVGIKISDTDTFRKMDNNVTVINIQATRPPASVASRDASMNGHTERAAPGGPLAQSNPPEVGRSSHQPPKHRAADSKGNTSKRNEKSSRSGTSNGNRKKKEKKEKKK